MPKLFLIAIGGSAGAVARYLLSGFAHRWTSGTFPVGTLFVNAVGCLAIGAVMGLIEDKGVLGPNVRWFIVIGFLGSFTTFSAFGYETIEMWSDGQLAAAGLNAIANFGLGVGAVLVGRLLVHSLVA